MIPLYLIKQLSLTSLFNIDKSNAFNLKYFHYLDILK